MTAKSITSLERLKQVAGTVLSLTVLGLLIWIFLYTPLFRPMFFPSEVQAEIDAQESLRNRIQDARKFVSGVLEADWSGYTAWYAEDDDEYAVGLQRGFVVKMGPPDNSHSDIKAHLKFDVGVALTELLPGNSDRQYVTLGTRLEGMNFTVAVWEKEIGTGDFRFKILKRWLPNP